MRVVPNDYMSIIASLREINVIYAAYDYTILLLYVVFTRTYYSRIAENVSYSIYSVRSWRIVSDDVAYTARYYYCVYILYRYILHVSMAR